MCGRVALTKPDREKIRKRFNLRNSVELFPRFNLCPAQDIPVILNISPDQLTLAHWGLIPSWSKDEKSPYSMINARAETILEKPAYKRLIKSKRCLIIADSFYEWKKVGTKKQPYRIMLKTEEPFAFAGLWDLWEKDGKSITSATIITTAPNKLMSEIHDRMPVIFNEEQEKMWMAGEDSDIAFKLLGAFDASKMKAYPVSTDVNNPRNDSPEIIQEQLSEK